MERIFPSRRWTSATRPGKPERPSSSSRVMSAAEYSGGPSGLRRRRRRSRLGALFRQAQLRQRLQGGVQPHPVPAQGPPGRVWCGGTPVTQQPQVEQRRVSVPGAQQPVRRRTGHRYDLSRQQQLLCHGRPSLRRYCVSIISQPSVVVHKKHLRAFRSAALRYCFASPGICRLHRNQSSHSRCWACGLFCRESSSS